MLTVDSSENEQIIYLFMLHAKAMNSIFIHDSGTLKKFKILILCLFLSQKHQIPNIFIKIMYECNWKGAKWCYLINRVCGRMRIMLDVANVIGSSHDFIRFSRALIQLQIGEFIHSRKSSNWKLPHFKNSNLASHHRHVTRKFNQSPKLKWCQI